MGEHDETIECPACYADNNYYEALLGTMGSLSHFRCRYCGAGFQTENEPPEEEEE